MLVTQENKVSLSEATFSKSENYFTDALSKTQQAKGQGIDIHEITATLFLSNQKHIEVLNNILEDIPKSQRSLYSLDAKRLHEFAKEITSLQVEK
jgi:predicted adenine nucleotide alpha hydrolase (AANH) superfamily ATPase